MITFIITNVFDYAALIKMSQYEWTLESLHCAKRFTRMALSPLLGSKPLKSRELFQQTWSKNKPAIMRNVK